MAAGALSHPGRSRRPAWSRLTALVALDARLHRRALDRDLASGVAAWRSPAHAARVTQLTKRRNRRGLAAALDNVIVVASLPASQQTHAVVIPCRASVQAAADQIHELAERLRSDAPVAAAGIVRLDALLCDGVGPVYAPGRAGALAQALAAAARWLDVEE